MTYAVVGSDKVATTLAMRFARSGVPFRLAQVREPVSNPYLAVQPSTSIRFTTFEEAADADVVILAIPFWTHRGLARRRLTWHGQIVVDAMYAAPSLGIRKSIDVVSHGFPGARIVKVLGRRWETPRASCQGKPANGNLAYLAGDNMQATKAVANLAMSLGYAPLMLNRFALEECLATRECCPSTQGECGALMCRQGNSLETAQLSTAYCTRNSWTLPRPNRLAESHLLSVCACSCTSWRAI